MKAKESHNVNVVNYAVKHINIKGARVHNLKGFDLSIPKNRLVAITGVSGSGKSSLVYDIIFAEGRKQYLQYWDSCRHLCV